jgi:hypothetical protein
MKTHLCNFVVTNNYLKSIIQNSSTNKITNFFINFLIGQKTILSMNLEILTNSFHIITNKI